MEPENEPRPCHHQLAVYALKSTPEVRLQKKQNHTVSDLEQFVLAKQLHYVPLRSAVSPKILAQWAQTGDTQ